MAKAKVREVDHGALKMLHNLKSLDRVVTVGIHASEGGDSEQDSSMTVAEVGAIHEFGLGVPQRSFLRQFVDENRSKLKAMLEASAREVAKGTLTSDQALERFGLAVQGMVRERIVAGIAPELAESTKERKEELTGGPKNTPLILFGQLLSSILHEVRDK